MVTDERSRTARPLIVVQDTAELSVLWMPHGTVRKVPDGAHIDPIYPVSRKDRIIADLARGDWHYQDHTWEVSTLVTMRPADSYAVWASWLPDGTHFGYYVNLQLPYRRTPIGFEAMDLMLDSVVQPDLSWQWKNDDEFEEIVELGLYSQDLARHIRAEAGRAIADLEARRWPFDGTLLELRPEPAPTAPVLHSGWQRPHATGFTADGPAKRG